MFRRLKFIIAGWLFGLSEAPKRPNAQPRSTSPEPESSRGQRWYSDAWTAMRSRHAGDASRDASYVLGPDDLRRAVKLDEDREALIRRVRAEADVRSVRRFVEWCKTHDIGIGLCHEHNGRVMVTDAEFEDFLVLYVESYVMPAPGTPK